MNTKETWINDHFSPGKENGNMFSLYIYSICPSIHDLLHPTGYGSRLSNWQAQQQQQQQHRGGMGHQQQWANQG